MLNTFAIGAIIIFMLHHAVLLARSREIANWIQHAGWKIPANSFQLLNYKKKIKEMDCLSKSVVLDHLKKVVPNVLSELDRRGVDMSSLSKRTIQDYLFDPRERAKSLLVLQRLLQKRAELRDLQPGLTATFANGDPDWNKLVIGGYATIDNLKKVQDTLFDKGLPVTMLVLEKLKVDAKHFGLTASDNTMIESALLTPTWEEWKTREDQVVQFRPSSDFLISSFKVSFQGLLSEVRLILEFY